MKRVWGAVRGQAGYSMTELLVVMVILGTILGGLTTAFVSGTNAELRANRRVQAQLEATAAFDRLRRDVHCASSSTATPGVAVDTITLSGCGSGAATWRTCPWGSRYVLYRNATSCPPNTIAGSCRQNNLLPTSTTGKLYADCLTLPSVFTYTAPVGATSLAKVHADVRVSVNPTQALDTFELHDDIVLRNSTRT